jgi:hypothetical protein
MNDPRLFGEAHRIPKDLTVPGSGRKILGTDHFLTPFALGHRQHTNTQKQLVLENLIEKGPVNTHTVDKLTRKVDMEASAQLREFLTTGQAQRFELAVPLVHAARPRPPPRPPSRSWEL